ncbi:MAG: hypothetical protein SF162_12625 [bacterium]|nr:hypothetical protein [bacterium]
MDIGLHQIWGIVRYEALMQWRRRTLIVLFGFFVVGIIGLSTLIDSSRTVLNRMTAVQFEADRVVIRYENVATGAPVEQVLTGDAAALVPRWFANVDMTTFQTTWEFLLLLVPGVLVLLLAIPPLVAEIIPLDSQYRIRELLAAAPLAQRDYLFGKVFSLWIGTGVGLAISTVIVAGYVHVRYGPVDALLIVRFWAVLMLPVALIMSGYAVLLGGLARTRRTAVFIGIALLAVSLLVANGTIITAYVSNPLFVSARDAGSAAGTYESLIVDMFNGAVNGAIPFAVALVGVWVLVWGVLRWKAEGS